MAIQYDKLFSVVTDYRNKKELSPFVNFLKKICENKQKISVDVTNDDGQNYCQALADAVIDKMVINTDEVLIIEVVTDCLLQQANLTNTRWYLLDKCQLLHCLARKFLSTQSVAVKIRIGRTMQTFLIYSRIDETSCLISLELVADLLKNLVFTIRGNFSQEFNETALGLLASLCQIWSTCSSVMNVIDDYQVLRKQLLRFLSAEMVKRTTIVYTMTIMFHLCNSDDRLFNKRNIRQTLQVLFNIMLNGENSWASLYAATLLTEICTSSRTSSLLTEYRTLTISVRDILAQLATKEKIVVEKFLEFILTLSSLSVEYRHVVMSAVISIDLANSDAQWDKNNKDSVPQDHDPIMNLINLIPNSEMSICICATKIIDDVYMELYSTSATEAKLPHLIQLGDTVHQFLSSIVSNFPTLNNSSYFNLLKSGDKLDSTNSIEQRLQNSYLLTYLTKVKHVMQLVTNLLVIGDDWLDQVATFVKNTDKIIINQMESNILVMTASNNLTSQQIQQVLINNDMAMRITSLSVEIFVDILYFYYRSTELRPTSSLFGERLKSHLENPICPIMLAFALSAATQNQSTLQRALVLQGVCLHLQDFNVELMGEKMYQFSNQFSNIKSQDSRSRSLQTPINSSTTNKTSNAWSKLTETSLANGDSSNTIMDTITNGIGETIVDSLINVDNETHPANMTGYNGDINYHNALPLGCSNQTVEVCANHNDLISLQMSKFNTAANKKSDCISSIKADMENDNNILAATPTNNSVRSIPTSTLVEKTINKNFSGDQIDKINMDTKVQQIVKKWMEHPEMNFSTVEVYAIFEHRIQSMQNQESLMEEIISNKTAALHQSEALLSQYRNKLIASEKESKQLRNLQVENESKIDFITQKMEQQKNKINELEKINQTLIETNRINEQQKQDSISINKKLQERVSQITEDKLRLMKSIEENKKKLEEINKQIKQKDNQISNYTNITKLINKLTGNRLPTESFLSCQMSMEELHKTISTPVNSIDASTAPPVPPPSLSMPDDLTNNFSLTSPHVDTTNNNCKISIDVIKPTLSTCDENNNNNIQMKPTNASPKSSSVETSKSSSQNNSQRSNNSSNNYANRPSISSADFLQLYKNNCRILQNHK